MWEARAEPGRLGELTRWLDGSVVPAARVAGATGHELVVAEEPEPRAVLVTRWPGSPEWSEPAPPDGLAVRWHGWTFRRVSAD
jgi:hypothetical protein